jgi:hypothetical protein
MINQLRHRLNAAFESMLKKLKEKQAGEERIGVGCFLLSNEI